MDPANTHDDAQRTLERRALLNVHSLAERLGYRDALDRKTESHGIRVLAAIAGVVVLALFILSQVPSTRADDEARRRCEIDAQAREGIRVKDQLMAARPDLTGKELQEELRERSKSMAAIAKAECARGSTGK